jgi:hypothetical protein
VKSRLNEQELLYKKLRGAAKKEIKEQQLKIRTREKKEKKGKKKPASEDGKSRRAR